MTKDLFDQQRKELQELSAKYPWKTMKELPEVEKDSLYKIQQQERKIINEKYKAMEQLTEEEKAAFDLRFKDVKKRMIAQRKANQEEAKMKTLRKLEEEVKIYIKWAKSQMGG